MPVQTPITVDDGKATPLARVFKALGVAAGVARYAESASDGSLLKRVTMIFTQKLPGKGRGTALEQIEIAYPYVVVKDGVEVVHSTVRMEVRMISDPAVPEAVIKDCFVIGRNMLANADMVTAFSAREGIN
jgi:hypothetical protein